MASIGEWSRRVRSGRRLNRLLLVVVFCGMAALVKASLLPPNQGVPAVKKFVVPPNATSRTVAQRLYEEGLIRSQDAFLIYLRISGKDRLLKAGEYQLADNLTLPQLVERLYQGSTTFYQVVIPEGYTLDQIADVLESKQLIDRDRFFELIERGEFNFRFIADLPAGPNRLEGFLFPATYQISADAGEKEIIELMLKRFDRFLTPAVESRCEELGISVRELVTLASMVEREARQREEQPIIAGVLYNRLEQGMLLQVDATVQYALGQHRERLYYKDLEVDSPYNTYRYGGLPPGPIASPGEGALQAVLYPARHRYLYYVAKPDGSHIFSTSLDEHNRARRSIVK
ncbi:MAG: endolytic transglycosylase MltG [Syntrophomonadaceae bacterium]|nr:endolytic transglycosylase MltG [Syntrophomonadaceae bacterium]